MPVFSTTSRWAYNGDGATTVFPYTNLIFSDTDLDVFVDDVAQTLNTDYTVSGANDTGGGAVTFISGAPAVGTSNVVIVRDVPLTQGTELPEGGPFPSDSVEGALDKLTVLVQQINDLLNNKALALDGADPALSLGRLPLKSSLASKFLAFDANGDPIGAAGTSADLAPVSAFMNELLDDLDAATARATLELGSLAVLNVLDEMAEDVRWTGVISPTELTASQNNYNPTNLATASKLRLSADAARNITGLQGGSSGRLLTLHNVGANNITLTNDSGSSTAANRFALAGNLLLRPNYTCLLQYDGTSSRWRALGMTPPLVSFPAADGSALQFLRTDGAGALSFGGAWITRDPIPTTSGTSVTLADDLAALATTSEIQIRFNAVSTNTTGQTPLLQIGPTGGVATSGYVMSGAGFAGAAIFENETTTGFPLWREGLGIAASATSTGTITLTRFSPGSNLWYGLAHVTDNVAAIQGLSFGFVTIAGSPGDIVLTTPGGTATFDAGEVVVAYR